MRKNMIKVETWEEKQARLKREEKIREEAEMEGLMMGLAMGRTTGRSLRMYGVGEVTGASD